MKSKVSLKPYLVTTLLGATMLFGGFAKRAYDINSINQEYPSQIMHEMKLNDVQYLHSLKNLNNQIRQFKAKVDQSVLDDKLAYAESELKAFEASPENIAYNSAMKKAENKATKICGVGAIVTLLPMIIALYKASRIKEDDP